jgi:FlaA1/EpsC-like NDP-sugar epimerase
MKLSSTPFIRLSVYQITRKPLRPSASKVRTYATKMQAVKNTIAENAGKIVSGAHSLAPADSQFSLEQVPDLSGKVAVVTGGSEGIGYGCTHTLLTHNVSKLFILSKSEDIVDDAINAIKEELGEEMANRVTWLQCDLSDWYVMPFF